MTTCPSGHTSQSTDYCDVCGMPIPAGAATAAAATSSAGASAAPVAPSTGPSAGPSAGSVGSSSTGLACPNCSVQNLPEALFCEACGYDFTTGTMPRTASEEDDTPTNEQPAVGVDGLPLAPVDPDAQAGAGANGTADPSGGELDQTAAAADAGTAPDQDGTGATAAPPTRPIAEWVAEIWVDPDWYRTQNSPDPLPSPGLPEVVLLSDPSVLVGRASQSRNIHPQIDCGNDSGVSRRHAQLTTDGRRWWVEDLQSSNGTFVAPASGPLPKDPIDPGDRAELNPDDRVYVGGWTRMVIRRATDEEKAAG